jgi:D-psicose/D-tagatose/L-ribulose 3-epimerase
MRYGAHIYILTDRWSDASLPLMDEARALGLDTLEIAVGDDVAFDAARAGTHARGLGLELVLSPGGLWPAECDLSRGDATGRRAALDWHKRQVDVAARAGAVAYAGAIYGRPGALEPRSPTHDDYERVADGLAALADHAAAAGIVIALEPMSHFRTWLVNTPAQVVRLLDRVDRPNVLALLDTYHMVTEVRDYGAAIRAVGARLWGLHACENDRGVPGGGLVPWDEVFRALADVGFGGRIILETYNSSLGDFAVRRGMRQNVCPDGPAFVRQGLAFLKGGLARTRGG